MGSRANPTGPLAERSPVMQPSDSTAVCSGNFDPFAGLEALADRPNGPTMEDCYRNETAAGRLDNAKKVKRLKRATGKELSEIVITERWLAENAPRHRKGQALPWDFRDVKTYKANRRGWKSALEHFFGEADAKVERRSREDGWNEVIVVLDHQVEGGLLHANALLPITSFVDRARKLGIEPHTLDARAIAAIDKDCLHSRQRRARHSRDPDPEPVPSSRSRSRRTAASKPAPGPRRAAPRS